MRSVRATRALVGVLAMAACCLLLLGGLSGCATTQDTAKAKKAESELFLKQREAHRAKHKAKEKKKGGDDK